MAPAPSPFPWALRHVVWPRALLVLLAWGGLLLEAQGQVTAVASFVDIGQQSKLVQGTSYLEGQLVMEGRAPMLDIAVLKGPFKAVIEAASGGIVNIVSITRDILEQVDPMPQRVTIRYQMLTLPQRVNSTKSLMVSSMLDDIIWPIFTKQCLLSPSCTWGAMGPMNGWALTLSSCNCVGRVGPVEQPLVWPFSGDQLITSTVPPADTTTAPSATTAGALVLAVTTFEVSSDAALFGFTEPVALTTRTDLQVQLNTLDTTGGAVDKSFIKLANPQSIMQDPTHLRVDLTGKLQPGTMYLITLPAWSVQAISGRPFSGKAIAFRTVGDAAEVVVDYTPDWEQANAVQRGTSSGTSSANRAGTVLIATVLISVAVIFLFCLCCCLVHRRLSKMGEDEMSVANSTRSMQKVISVHRSLSRMGSRLHRSFSHIGGRFTRVDRFRSAMAAEPQHQPRRGSVQPTSPTAGLSIGFPAHWEEPTTVSACMHGPREAALVSPSLEALKVHADRNRSPEAPSPARSLQPSIASNRSPREGSVGTSSPQRDRSPSISSNRSPRDTGTTSAPRDRRPSVGSSRSPRAPAAWPAPRDRSPSLSSNRSPGEHGSAPAPRDRSPSLASNPSPRYPAPVPPPRDRSPSLASARSPREAGTLSAPRDRSPGAPSPASSRSPGGVSSKERTSSATLRPPSKESSGQAYPAPSDHAHSAAGGSSHQPAGRASPAAHVAPGAPGGSPPILVRTATWVAQALENKYRKEKKHGSRAVHPGLT